MVGLITHSKEVEKLEAWCKVNSLSINVKKTTEMIVDLRKTGTTPPLLDIRGAAVEVVSCFKYLVVHISDILTWSINTTRIVKKAHQHL